MNRLRIRIRHSTGRVAMAGNATLTSEVGLYPP